jgi:integrase
VADLMMSNAVPTMEELARRYLEHRRQFGYRLLSQGYGLFAFARFADWTAPGQPITVALALRWAKRQPALPITVASRLSIIRGFAGFCATFDARTEAMPARLTNGAPRRRAPHVYTSEQVRLILRRTDSLKPWRTNLRPITYRTLIGLLACTGLRTREALRLRDEDFDATAGTLRVPPTKFTPVRILPLHPSAVRALRRYQTVRRKYFPVTSRFFVGPYGRPLTPSAVQWTFRRLVHDIPSNGARPRPRLYDFRHTFATTLISRWSRQANPIPQRLVLLCRYLGHKYFHHTYWYVQHELAALRTASARFKNYHKQPSSG